MLGGTTPIFLFPDRKGSTNKNLGQCPISGHFFCLPGKSWAMSAVLVNRGAGIYEERLAGYGIDALKGMASKEET